MKSMSRNTKLKTTEKILILCEGETEEGYINGLLSEYNLSTSNVEVQSLNGGGYSSVKKFLDKNKKILNIVLVIMDLDRSSSVSNEKAKLKSLIKTLENLNVKNNIFLTYPNFETWVAACLNCDEMELKKKGYQKGNAVYKFIRNNQGSYKTGVDVLSGREVYFEKKDYRTGVFYEEQIDKKHSALYYFIDYLSGIITRKD